MVERVDGLVATSLLNNANQKRSETVAGLRIEQRPLIKSQFVLSDRSGSQLDEPERLKFSWLSDDLAGSEAVRDAWAALSKR